MENGFYIYFLVFFFGSNITNHDHVGGLKQLKFIFPLLSQPEVWDKGVGELASWAAMKDLSLSLP